MRGRGEREPGTAEDSKARLFIIKGWARRVWTRYPAICGSRPKTQSSPAAGPKHREDRAAPQQCLT
jgi:hypothetical protein